MPYGNALQQRLDIKRERCEERELQRSMPVIPGALLITQLFFSPFSMK